MESKNQGLVLKVFDGGERNENIKMKNELQSKSHRCKKKREGGERHDMKQKEKHGATVGGNQGKVNFLLYFHGKFA